MGLLDKLINRGTQALGDFVSDKVSDVMQDENSSIGGAFRDVKSAVSSITGQNANDSWEESLAADGVQENPLKGVEKALMKR